MTDFSPSFTVVHYDADSEEAERLRNEAPSEWAMRAVQLPLTEATARQAADTDALTVFIHSQVTSEALSALPRLRLLCTRSTGYDHIDLKACQARGIAVCNVPTYGENTVAEHTFGLILSLSRNIHRAWERTRRGDFSLEGLRGFDLQGRTLGIVGTGHIGLHVARIGRGFGMRVLAHDPVENSFMADLVGFTYVSLDELLKEADIVSLHAPLLPFTHHLLNRERLACMKQGALLINTARGGLIDSDALVEALDSRHLGGAALDVFEGEELIHEDAFLSDGQPQEADQGLLRKSHEILRRENVVLTPHMAFFSTEAEDRIRETTVRNIEKFLAGQPVNVVSTPES